MRRTTVLAATLALLMAFSVPASGVMFGEPDEDNVWSNVAMLVFGIDDEEQGFIPSHRCTGTLIDEDTILTAGHCTEAPPLEDGQSWIALANFDWTFEPDRLAQFLAHPDTLVGDPVTHEDFAFPSFDIGLVNLAEPTDIEAAPMADVGTLDPLATRRGQQDTTLDVVGYGVQGVRPVASDDWTRHTGTVQLVNLRSSLTAGFGAVQVTSNPGQPHRGGLCFGDSGGALFYDGEIVAVNSFVLNSQCMGSGFSIRVDDQDVQDWIAANS